MTDTCRHTEMLLSTASCGCDRLSHLELMLNTQANHGQVCPDVTSDRKISNRDWAEEELGQGGLGCGVSPSAECKAMFQDHAILTNTERFTGLQEHRAGALHIPGRQGRRGTGLLERSESEMGRGGREVRLGMPSAELGCPREQ